MSGDTFNQPAQPSYGEGMADALKAQVQLLTGTGDFASTGSLESLLPLEESIRKQTAQTDTDILRQTLLGGGTGEKYADDGRIIVGYDEPTGQAGGYKIDTEIYKRGDGSLITSGIGYRVSVIDTATGKIVDQKNEPPERGISKVTEESAKKEVGKFLNTLDYFTPQQVQTYQDADFPNALTFNTSGEVSEATPIYKKDAEGKDVVAPEGTFTPGESVGRTGDGMVDLLGDKRNVQDTVAREVTKTVGGYKQTATGGRLGSPVFSIFDNDGNEIQSGLSLSEIPSNTPEATETTENVYEQVDSGRQAGFATAAEGGGFLGLSALAEDVQAGNLSRQRERDLQDVARLSRTYQDIMEDYKPGTQEALESARKVLESQQDSLTGAGAIQPPTDSTFSGEVGGQTFDAATIDTPVDLSVTPSMTGATVVDPLSLTADTNYDAIDPVTGQTLTAGTTYTPSVNVQGSGYTAADVGNPMNLTADTSYDPSTNIQGGTFDAATSYNAARAADPLALSAATSYNPSAGVSGIGYNAVAGLSGGQIQADSLRARLMADAEAGLDQGLTAREERQIAEAARARSTMMGRTFDQQGTIAEAQARVAEDNARKMQNRVFAQQALRQEAGLQESDLGRALQASMQNQAAQNQALQYSSGQDMQAQLANQAAINQALQAGMAAGLSQEALAAQQEQAQEFANMQASNRASEFGVSARMDQQAQSNQQAIQAALANQQASNQAAQQGMQAGLSQEALKAQQLQTSQLANQQATNRAAEFGSTQALNAALANQQASNRAEEFGVQAGLGQEQAQAEFAQQANLANLASEQQREESGLQAGLGQEQLRANLAQQKAMAEAQFIQQARAANLEAGLGQELSEAQLNQARLQANQQAEQQAALYGAESAQQGALRDAQNRQQASQFDAGASMDAQRLNEQLKQSGILGYIQAAGGLAALEDQSTLDPFQAVLGRGGGSSLQAGQSVFGQAGYGLNSQPQYLNPESGLGFIQNQATNAANMFNAQTAADATRTAGIFGGLGSIAGGLGGGMIAKYCWVAREVYGANNPAWMAFRFWMLNESPSWFFKLYVKYGERFARFISDKPRLKARIRRWMDTKIGR